MEDGDEPETSIGTIFVSKNTWSGALGGTAGADAKCQTSAQFAGLTGTWRAIISDHGRHAKDVITDGVFRRIDGVTVANNKADLFDGSIQNPINVDEYGSTLDHVQVWTGSNKAGEYYDPLFDYECHSWSWTSDGWDGIFGDNAHIDASWITVDTLACRSGAHLYCVRVA